MTAQPITLLGINLTKCMYALYGDNYTEDKKKKKDMKENGEISHITKLSIIKMLLYHISAYKYYVIPIQIPMRFFPIKLTKLFLKFIPKNKVSNIAKNCEQGPQLPVPSLTNLQHQGSVVLLQVTNKSVDQNTGPQNKLQH